MTGNEWRDIVVAEAKRRRMTFSDIGRAMGLYPQITQFINGQRGRQADPSLSTMTRIATALGCELRVRLVRKR